MKTESLRRSGLLKQYKVWKTMIARCENPRDNRFYAYGARGISVCQRWRDSFYAFVEDMGVRPDGDGASGRMTLDRIDNDGNYGFLFAWAALVS